MGRNAQNIDLLVAKGNKHFTKAEIAARKEAEVKLGEKDLKKIKPPAYVINNLVAYEKWKSLIKEYKEAAKNDIEILTSTDIEILAKYCITYSEYLSLIDRRNRVDDIDFVGLDDKLKKTVRGEKRKAMNELMRIEQVLKIETAINKKHDLLIKLEDRLFLNPLAKVKNVPKSAKEKPKNPMEAKFNI